MSRLGPSPFPSPNSHPSGKPLYTCEWVNLDAAVIDERVPIKVLEPTIREILKCIKCGDWLEHLRVKNCGGADA